jgi:hypothetical protein
MHHTAYTKRFEHTCDSCSQLNVCCADQDLECAARRAVLRRTYVGLKGHETTDRLQDKLNAYTFLERMVKLCKHKSTQSAQILPWKSTHLRMASLSPTRSHTAPASRDQNSRWAGQGAAHASQSECCVYRESANTGIISIINEEVAVSTAPLTARRADNQS